MATLSISKQHVSPMLFVLLITLITISCKTTTKEPIVIDVENQFYSKYNRAINGDIIGIEYYYNKAYILTDFEVISANLQTKEVSLLEILPVDPYLEAKFLFNENAINPDSLRTKLPPYKFENFFVNQDGNLSVAQQILTPRISNLDPEYPGVELLYSYRIIETQLNANSKWSKSKTFRNQLSNGMSYDFFDLFIKHKGHYIVGLPNFISDFYFLKLDTSLNKFEFFLNGKDNGRYKDSYSPPYSYYQNKDGEVFYSTSEIIYSPIQKNVISIPEVEDNFFETFYLEDISLGAVLAFINKKEKVLTITDSKNEGSTLKLTNQYLKRKFDGISSMHCKLIKDTALVLYKNDESIFLESIPFN
ncbi:hypothetical protein [Luteibaculum oceani]|uniref:Uncharacterized protein n=1 Tax=Luteibaculum oceani TaxID=1294296 RepID=A0A5C6USJ9_9FLAO|nr:hypothetical protein [Luteibaculum oceani]TXC75624.1 hypothetical protein FRX97_11640 [Luteibaculum oceani]